MSKTIKIAAMGLAALGFAGAPVLGASAADGTGEVTDKLEVTINSACSLTQQAGDWDANPFNSYSAVLANDNAVELSTGATAVKTMKIVCNDTAGWELKAQGVSGVGESATAQTALMHENGTDSIPAGVAGGLDGDTSEWGFKIASSDTTNVKTTVSTVNYTEWQAITSAATTIAYSAGEIADVTITPSYKVSANHTQAAGKYTGYVKYTLIHPDTIVESN